MPTTFNFASSASQIIRDALLDCGGLGEHETASGQAVTDAIRRLNNLAKSWQTQGYHLWTRKEVTVFLNAGQGSYLLGPGDDAAHWAETYGTTLLNGAHIAGDTTPTVDSSTGIDTGDQIGIELTDGTRQWTTVQTDFPLTLTAGLTGAASDNATVYYYTARPQRPLKILHARRSSYGAHDLAIEIQSLDEYQNQTNKTTNGTPIFVAYKPSLVNGVLYVWQPGTVRQFVKMTIAHPFADFDVTADNPDFPVEWIRTITKNLAVELEPSYRTLSAGRRQELRRDAQVSLAEAQMFDADSGPTYFQPG